jgi:uncharacterized membrane protein
MMDLTFRRVLRCFIAGVFAVLPVAITVAIVAWVGGFLRRLLGPGTLIGDGIRRLGLSFASDDTLAYLIGGALVLAVIFAIGVAVEVGAKNLLPRLVDAVLSRVPLVGSVYGTSKQVVNLLNKKDDDGLKGMRAVFCIFGAEHGAGVLALLVSPERFQIAGREYHIVIVPTAPVPIGGGMLFMPVENVRSTDVSVEALMSIYVSMGITAPQFLTCERRDP